MKTILNVNRSGKAGSSSVVSVPSGVEILPQPVGFADYEVFLVAKGLSDYGVGEIINPDDYFTADKSIDVYALLCARPEVKTVSGQGVNVYPIFFIAHVAGMSRAFVAEEGHEAQRTVCLDIIQRTGAGDVHTPMQHRTTLNLHVRSIQDIGNSFGIFRPSWDRYIPFPDDALDYEQEAYPTDWPIAADNQLIYRILDKSGNVRFGPYVTLCTTVAAPAFHLKTTDISMRNDWAVWCCQGGDKTGEQITPTVEFYTSLSFPFARVSEGGDPLKQSPIWMCFMAMLVGPASLTPIAYQPLKDTWGDVATENLTLLMPGPLQSN